MLSLVEGAGRLCPGQVVRLVARVVGNASMRPIRQAVCKQPLHLAFLGRADNCILERRRVLVLLFQFVQVVPRVQLDLDLDYIGVNTLKFAFGFCQVYKWLRIRAQKLASYRRLVELLLLLLLFGLIVLGAVLLGRQTGCKGHVLTGSSSFAHQGAPQQICAHLLAATLQLLSFVLALILQLYRDRLIHVDLGIGVFLLPG